MQKKDENRSVDAHKQAAAAAAIDALFPGEL